MGSTYYYGCSNCDFEKSLTQGIGFMFAPDHFQWFDRTDNFNMWGKVITSEKMLAEVEEILNRKDGLFDEKHYGYEIYYSKSCKTLHSRFYFRLYYYDESGKRKLYTPKYYDQNKKRMVKVKEEDIPDLDLVCPKCKSKITIDPNVIVESLCWD